jgi:hypothetical protein
MTLRMRRYGHNKHLFLYVLLFLFLISLGVPAPANLRSLRKTFKHDSLAYPAGSSGDCARYRIRIWAFCPDVVVGGVRHEGFLYKKMESCKKRYRVRLNRADLF